MIGDRIFTVLDIPYANALTMGQFDASTRFTAGMPASHVAYSLQTLGLYLSPGQTVRPDVLEWPEVQEVGVQKVDPSECGYLEIDCHLEKFLGSDIVKDYSKRVGLVLLAIVLIVVAIVSLR